MDPPFGPKNEDTYYGVGDNLEEFLAYIKERVLHLTKGRRDFNFVLQVDPKASHYLKVELDKVLGRENFQNEIIWGFSGPSVSKRHLPRKHGVVLWWGLGDYPYNPVRVPYKEGLSVGGKTSWAKGEADVEGYLEKGKLLEDWWVDIPALVRNEKEKRGYATQKPVKLLERIVGMLSNKGGLVIDPMFGSGTTGLAALRLGRSFLGSDLNPEALKIAEQALRLEEKEVPFWEGAPASPDRGK